MTDYTRVRDTRTGHEYTVTTAVATADDNLTPLDTPALDVNGSPLPPSYPNTEGEATPDAPAPDTSAETTTIPRRGAEKKEKE